MKVVILAFALALAGLAVAPVASAEPVCAGTGPFEACVDPEDLAVLDPPIYCLQVQDAPCP